MPNGLLPKDARDRLMRASKTHGAFEKLKAIDEAVAWAKREYPKYFVGPHHSETNPKPETLKRKSNHGIR